MRTLRWRRARNQARRNSHSEFSRVLIKPSDCGDKLPIRWPKKEKWYILCVIFLVQVSMNLNTTLYSNGIQGIAHEYGLSYFQVRWGGAASFLIAYAFGCELWAPWSEEYGRRHVLQASLFFVNMWAILVGFSPTWYGHVVGRTLGGLSSAGGSVTLALITDMFDPHSAEHQHATAFIVFSSVGGSILGPIFGGVVEAYLAWRWVIWIQIIFGVMVQLLHYFLVPETRTTIVMDRTARELRESGVNPTLYGPNEISGDRRINWSEVWKIWLRPFKMFFTEPIVLVFSLLSGFSDAIIFMMVQSFGFVYWQWGFGPILLGCTFLPIGIGYMIGYALAYYFIGRQIALRERKPLCERAQYEARLFWLLFAAPLLPIGLLLFAFTAAYTEHPLHWIFSMIASCMIGIANFAIYMGTIDYVLRAYGPYAASATGGNGWARDFLAGVLTPYAVPMVSIIATIPIQ
ncbi:MFS general substrate transporter [Daldinia loculata]|uniref:MFS general substrate transporter n=1 Tax=Daldinia loculata TaxID=103429 RepID=UPI0020C3FDA0|nr:MFS general substrate transporter [Daldinia loculata]KAI1649327.1 MFS general substrate transporter [Daldinia loculata]